jgi:sugar/nucleoside kinase (ribokinase family)
MNTAQSFDVVYIGNYTKDTITSPAGTRYVDGGACNYAAHAGARLGKRVAVVTHLAKEDDRVIERLRQAGVTCFPTYTPQSTNVKLDYPTQSVDIRNLYVTSTAGSIAVGEVEPFETRAAVIGTTLRGEVGLDVILALRQKDLLLAADVQGFVRVLQGQSLVYQPWEEMAEILSYLDVLKSDAVEAQFLTGEADIHKAAERYASYGPKEIVLTHQDGVLIYAGGEFSEAGFYPEKMDGRSGRGDTCLGSYVAMRLQCPPAEAGIWAAALTSLKMETLGPFQGSLAQVEDLISRKYRNGSSR